MSVHVRNTLKLLMVLALSPGLTGCMKEKAGTAEAATLYSKRCAPCHGERGKGDGVASASLNPRPQDFSDPDWQHKVTQEHLEKVIVSGGAAVGKSLTMPPNPDLGTRPEVVKALVAKIRSFKQ